MADIAYELRQVVEWLYMRNYDEDDLKTRENNMTSAMQDVERYAQARALEISESFDETDIELDPQTVRDIALVMVEAEDVVDSFRFRRRYTRSGGQMRWDIAERDAQKLVKSCPGWAASRLDELRDRLQNSELQSLVSACVECLQEVSVRKKTAELAQAVKKLEQSSNRNREYEKVAGDKHSSRTHSSALAAARAGATKTQINPRTAR